MTIEEARKVVQLLESAVSGSIVSEDDEHYYPCMCRAAAELFPEFVWTAVETDDGYGATVEVKS